MLCLLAPLYTSIRQHTSTDAEARRAYAVFARTYIHELISVEIQHASAYVYVCCGETRVYAVFARIYIR